MQLANLLMDLETDLLATFIPERVLAFRDLIHMVSLIVKL